ncbi:hypothetical protein E4P39_03955 [Blastococcus sp. CT_GayMR19]|uniref:hypothetical protein n=1 Tax=Blastococcus sp. CT_GayMR19 TaxID=2559608 RepID=UPI001073AC91|nr:hypothetical protein [Blastococcus sp. CT_GayMR19]TFV78378.1 hypothetical protein E4P39_03955 [Blastococcus sp. CT_GayMR19]
MSGIGDAKCATTSVAVLPGNLAAATRAGVYRLAADLALHNNVTIVIVGQSARNELVLCGNYCCIRRPGAIAVVPDVDALSLWEEPPRAARMERNDGRVVYLMAGPGPAPTCMPTTYPDLARRTWPEALWIRGEGRYATVRGCGGITVLLHPTEAEARAALGRMHPFGANGTCESYHDLVVLGDLTGEPSDG